MKKLFYLLLIIALYGCTSTCLIAQPPQYLYITSGCQAPLPDYLTKITASDNCSLSSLVQTPAPGYLLTAANQTVTVKITATDSFKNVSSISFLVTLLDTIAPVINYTGLTADLDPIINMYDRADSALLKYANWFDSNFPLDSVGGANIDTLWINYSLISDL